MGNIAMTEMGIIINPALDDTHRGHWFRLLSEVYGTDPRVPAKCHALVDASGRCALCRRCHGAIETARGDRRARLIDEAGKLINGMLASLGATVCGNVIIRMTNAGLWHKGIHRGALIHTPFIGKSGHEVLEAIAAASEDPSFGCRGFQATKEGFR